MKILSHPLKALLNNDTASSGMLTQLAAEEEEVDVVWVIAAVDGHKGASLVCGE